VFDIPRLLWKSGFDAFSMSKVVTFEEYSAQRGNPDFVRDFNLMCSQSPYVTILNSKTGDRASIHKGFLHEMFLNDEADATEDDSEAKYAFLA